MELIDVTPDDSIVPVYVEKLTAKQQAERDADLAAIQQAEADRQAELEAREQLRQSAISKLVAGQPLTTAEAELLVIR